MGVDLFMSCRGDEKFLGRFSPKGAEHDFARHAGQSRSASRAHCARKLCTCKADFLLLHPLRFVINSAQIIIKVQQQRRREREAKRPQKSIVESEKKVSRIIFLLKMKWKFAIFAFAVELVRKKVSSELSSQAALRQRFFHVLNGKRKKEKACWSVTQRKNRIHTRRHNRKPCKGSEKSSRRNFKVYKRKRISRTDGGRKRSLKADKTIFLPNRRHKKISKRWRKLKAWRVWWGC